MPMCIEYFQQPKVLLIYGRDPTAIGHLRQQIVELATARISSFAVHDLPGFCSVNGCMLFANQHTLDLGTWPDPKQPAFRCRLKPNAWDNIDGLLEPFTDWRNLNTGHQYLDGCGDVQMIVSGTRAW